ncbi:MAG TPA: type I-C CRISPR-associated protein Cas8c/Csd1 [Rhodanobacteraceae bacterium]
MILAALNDYYARLRDDPESGVAAPGYSQEKISFAVVLDVAGKVVDVNDLREQAGKKLLPKIMAVPYTDRTSGIKSKFLWDNTNYVLGIGAPKKDADKEEKEKGRRKLCHAAFVALHDEVLAGADDQGLQALLAFLHQWTPDQFSRQPVFQTCGEDILDTNVVFRLDGTRGFVHEQPAARQYLKRLEDEADEAPLGMCLVTGEMAPLARVHPSIRGFKEAPSGKSAIVSFNDDAFESYGKSQGENAPVSQPAAFAYTTALNHLLRPGPANRQRLQLGDTTVVFWAQAPDADAAAAGEDLLAAFFDPKDDDVRATRQLDDALELVRTGRPLRDLGSHLEDGTRIFVLGLAPNASRLSIRFWLTDTLDVFARRLADHFDDMALQPVPWRKPPSLRWLAMQTAPTHGDRALPEAKDVPPQLAGELARAVLTGSAYPQSLLGTLVMRFRADGHVTGLRVALCKAVLARSARLDHQHGKTTQHGDVPMSLDTACTDAGYLLGRLFSSLENIQRAALGDKLNATIRDRYYGAASATPASIFPVLLRNTQNHLAKVRKDKAGWAVNLEKDLGQIIDALPTTFPRSLPIEEQGRFAIGYYHQTRARFASHDDATNTTDSEGDNA